MLYEVITIIKEKPDVVINIVDGTSIERNLYLTLQIMETGIPLVVAVRITSYNVCYTKLLRNIMVSKSMIHVASGCPFKKSEFLKENRMIDIREFGAGTDKGPVENTIAINKAIENASQTRNNFV